MIAIFPEIIHASEKKNIELLSILVRKYFGGDKAKNPRVDIHTIFENVGIELDKRAIEEQGVIVAKDEKGRFRASAVIQTGISGIEERFLLAHLLGHYFLDIEPFVAKGDWSSSGFKDSLSAFSRFTFGAVPFTMADAFAKETRDEKRERLADDFAAALLMPKGMVKHAIQKLGDLEKIGLIFGVPKQCLERRLEMLGLIENESSHVTTTEEYVPAANEFDLNAIIPPPTTTIKGVAASSYKQADSQVRPLMNSFNALGNTPEGNPTQTKFQAKTLQQQTQSSRQERKPARDPGDSGTSEKSSSLKGLARIREIAARLDKSVAK